MASFTQLHTLSEFSLLRAPLRLADLVEGAAEAGFEAVALTDRGNLFGAVEFHERARRAGLRPIHGLETLVVEDRRATDRRRRGRPQAMVLLAEDLRGWHSLLKLSSRAYLEGLFEGEPHVDPELLDAHREGLIALSGGREGAVATALRDGDLEAAEREVLTQLERFGRDHYFVQIENHGLESEARVRELATELARRTGVRLVATNHVHYRRPENAAALEVVWAIRCGQTVDDPNLESLPSREYWLKDEAAMRALFVDFPDAVDNAIEIAERCRVELERGRYLLPEFPLPDGFDDPVVYLEHLAREGAVHRYGGIDDRVERRLRHELDIISGMGFAGYFLIVGDFVRAARDRDIPVGPGRGSAAGSLVCYCLGITDVDPLAHDLLFERFLNPERVSMPDIDIDFCFEKREQVIDYVVQTYGAGSVCQIITFGKMLARGVVRDVGRALGMGFGEVDRIAKMVPEELGITLAEALEKSEDLRNVREEDPRYERLLHVALELEGLRRHSSIHAAGVLIAPGDLTDNVPLYRSSKDEVTTQWDMVKVESMGLLKMDFLGLRTLTVIDKALKFLPALGGPRMQPGDIPLDDPEIYELLGRGETVGVFQLESSGMQEILRKLKPSGFDDITAVNALYRPGPLGAGMVDDFIDRKHGRKAIRYEHPLLAPILEETYGVILYQEQVMRIAVDMAGYSLGEADQLRRAMGKKKQSEMDRHRTIFVEGAKQRGVDAEVADHVFELMAYFAGYGFNKSHSASYAVLAVQTAWLKAHWPAAFMASSLTSEMNNTDRVVTLVDECRRLGLQVTPPDVNVCTADFRPFEGGIRFGLGAIKNVGVGAIEAIVEARERLGRPFRDLFEFCEEIDSGRVNRRVVEALILSGALDALPGRREQKLAGLDQALARAQRRARDRDRGQAGLFDAVEDSVVTEGGVLPDTPAWSDRERLTRERELVGLYLSGHPLDGHGFLLRALAPRTAAQVLHLAPDTPVVLCGIVTAVKTILSRKSGQLVAFVSLDDPSGALEMICFGEAYERHRRDLGEERILLVCARTTRREGDEVNKLLLDRAMRLDEACRRLVRAIHLRLPVDIDAARTEALLGAIAAHPGECQLLLHVDTGKEELPVRARRAKVAPVPELVAALVEILGEDGVRLDAIAASSLAPERATPRWARAREGTEGA